MRIMHHAEMLSKFNILSQRDFLIKVCPSEKGNPIVRPFPSILNSGDPGEHAGSRAPGGDLRISLKFTYAR